MRVESICKGKNWVYLDKKSLSMKDLMRFDDEYRYFEEYLYKEDEEEKKPKDPFDDLTFFEDISVVDGELVVRSDSLLFITEIKERTKNFNVNELFFAYEPDDDRKFQCFFFVDLVKKKYVQWDEKMDFDEALKRFKEWKTKK